ncbi:MAG: sensor histidine kinase [Armatimonadota bacterium]|nr:sensor histidine kinase [Armatimonadota bacterium]
MPDHLYAALGRLARLAPGQEPGDYLAAALREAAALVGADLLVVRLPKGTCDHIEMRWPKDATWPPARMLARWHKRVIKAVTPVKLDVGARTRRAPWKHGVAIPVFTATGGTGVLAAFFASRRLTSRDQHYALSLPVQSALARIEAMVLRSQTEALASASVHERLAREIHDGPLQMLAGVLLHLRAAGRGIDPKAKKTIVQLDAELRQAVTQMRSLIRRLRVAQPETSLEERIRSALARLEQTRGISWTLRWREPKNLLPATAVDEMFHVINEALANVYRHSQAKHVSIAGRLRADEFEVVVSDDGVGFNVSQALRRDLRSLSFGLMGMQERMSALGGTLTLRSQPGQGTRVVLSVPLAQPTVGKSA